MAKVDIWMPLYIGDYMADTMRLTTEQHGAYLLLLMEQWMTGPLKDDDEELAAITKLPLDRWLSQRGKLSRFFVIEGGEWSQPRLKSEKEAAESRRKTAAENGKKGGRPKAKAKPNETHGFSEGIPSTEPEQNLDGNPQKSSSPSPSHTLQPNGCNFIDDENPPAIPQPKKKRKSQIPDDFALTGHLRGLAIKHWAECNRLDLDADDVFAGFVAHHKSKGNTMLDWNAAWTTWYMNAPKFTPAPRGQTNASNQQPDKPRSAVDRVKAGIEQRSREREEALARQRQAGDDARPAVGADDRDLRAQMDERLRGLSGGRVGDCIDGDYTRDDPPWAGSHGY